MARTHDHIDAPLAAFIARQPMFFVGTAPLAADGHVNVSPKGPGGTLKVLGPRRVGYLDLFGSGAETVAHLRENGRIVIMLCAFEGPPRIVRLHGRGEAVAYTDARFAGLVEEGGFALTTVPEGRRAVVLVEVERIASSCGYGVPLMEHAGERPHMALSKEKRVRTAGPAAYDAYAREANGRSIDGLPALA